MRVILAVLLCGGLLRADVLVLKDGRKIPGKVVEKPGHYELTDEGGLKTFLREEVEKVLASPKDLLDGVDAGFEEAKKEFTEAVDLKDAARQTALLKQAIAKVTRVREAYAAARELFPEDKYADLDLKLVQVMQLMRLLRERVGSEVARSLAPPAPAPAGPARPAAPPPPPPPPPPPAAALGLQDALAILCDPAKRAEPSLRSTARDAFRTHRASLGAGPDVGTAALLFLSRPEADWKLQGPAQAAFQDYLQKPWFRGAPAAADHLQAASHLAAAAKTSPAAAEALGLFAMAHLSQAPAGPESDRAAQGLGLAAREGRLGTLEGHAVRDLGEWIASGDFDFAALAYAREFKAAADTPSVRFLWAVALLRQALARARGYEKAAAALEAVRPADPAFRDHVAALAKSVKNVAVCSSCSGAGKSRCTACHGRKEVRTDCAPCRGTGAVNLTPCRPCGGRGFLKLQRCSKCRDGFPECRACDKRPRQAPSLDDVLLGAPCAPCEGRGTAFRALAIPCRSCWGLGQKLTPRADPSKILPY